MVSASDQKHYNHLKTVYLSAPANSYYHPHITIHEGHAELRLKIKSQYLHAGNAVHGAVIFKMMDDVGFFASNSLVRDVFVLTANFSIHYLRPVASGILISHAHVIHHGKRQLITDTTCLNDKGKKIAQGRGVYMPTDLPITPYEQ